MDRFSVENAAYTRLWDSQYGPTIINMIINDPDLLPTLPHYYPTAFSIGEFVPADLHGNASFTVKADFPAHSTVMDMRSPLGEGKPMEEGEEMSYSGSIKGFISPTWKQDAGARAYEERLMAKYGSDAAILKGFATKELAPRIQSGYHTLDYLALRVETTYKSYYGVGRGLKGGIYAIPQEYRQYEKAGAKAWTDPTADIIASVMAIQEKKWLEWSVEVPMQLKVTKDFFQNVIMKNENIINTIKTNWLTAQGQLVAGIDNVSNWVITEENFNRYVAATIPDFPKLTIVNSKQLINGVLVDPWEPGIAILCPNTLAGRILRTDSQDEEIYSKYGNNACSFAFSRTADGLMFVMNSVLPNGSLTERQMKVCMDAVPVLTDFQYRVLIKTNEADD